MKNEGIKRQCADGRTVLNHFLKISILLLLIFSSPQGQISVNGFCGVDIYKTDPGNNGIFSFDINQDGIKDYMLFGADEKRVTIHFSKNKETLENGLTKFFYYPITDITRFKKLDNKDQAHVFISRKEMLAGLISFTKYGTIKLLNQFEFESYPGNVVAEDIDNDGKLEVLVYGEAFDGISVLRENKYVLEEDKIFENHLLSNLIFTDLNFDDSNDIIAYDIVSESLVMLYNDGLGNFELKRTVPLNEQLLHLKFDNINKDDYTDLIYSTNSGFTVIEGDSVFSCGQKYKIPVSDPPSKFLYNDFNNNGQKDLAYINQSKSALRFNFSIQETAENNNELIIDCQAVNNIYDIKKQVFVLSEKGFLYKFKNINDEKEFNLIADGNVKEIKVINDKKFTCVALLENNPDRLKLFYTNSKKPFSHIINIPLSFHFSEFNFYQTNSKLNFNCFISDSTIYEVCEFDLNNLTSKNTTGYTEFPIVDIAGNDLLMMNSDTLLLNLSQSDSVSMADSNVIKSKLMKKGEYVSLSYWTKNENKFSVQNVEIKNDTLMKKIIQYDFHELAADKIIFPRKNNLISIIKSDQKTAIIDLESDLLFLSDSEITFPFEYELNRDNVSIHKISEKEKLLFIRDLQSNINEVKINDGKIVSAKIIAENVDDTWVITNFLENNLYIIYFSPTEKIIKLKKVE
ncbi:MAG: hypothetical protein JEY94_04480 [Melioribacteraceae bacterium]|nr:hypothetical protein [Melioribacteraceae bacterium]